MKIFIGLCASLGLIAVGWGTPPQNQGPDAELAKTALEWEGGVNKTSAMKDGQTQISETFRFKNTGSQDVTISSVTASCGCTIPGFTKDPVPPSGSGEIVLVYSSKMPGVGRTVSANVVLQSGEQVKIEWVVQNSPNPSYFSPVSIPTQIPLVEWKPSQQGELSVRVDFPPGTRIKNISENTNVSTTFEEILEGSGTYMIKFARKNENPFWGAVSIETSNNGAPPYRVNIRALR